MKSARPEVRGTTDFDDGAYPPPKTSPTYALTPLIIFRFGRAAETDSYFILMQFVAEGGGVCRGPVRPPHF